MAPFYRSVQPAVVIARDATSGAGFLRSCGMVGAHDRHLKHVLSRDVDVIAPGATVRDAAARVKLLAVDALPVGGDRADAARVDPPTADADRTKQVAGIISIGVRAVVRSMTGR